MKWMLMFVLVAGTGVMMTACSSDDDETTEPNEKPRKEEVIDMLPQTRAVELTEEQRSFAKQNTDFSFNLFRTISQMSEGKRSIIISPISVTYLLGMLNDGAAGNTGKEITSLLGFGEGNSKAVNEFCKKLIEDAPKTDPSVMLSIANTVIGNKDRDVKFASQFQKNMIDYYHAELNSLGFSDKKGTLNQVNGWCNKHTDGMIPEILSENELSNDALLLLMNAICFKATWTDKFDPEDTRDETFTTNDGQQKTIPMMHRKAHARYGENDDCSILYLPYGSGDLWSMRVLLPKEGKTVDDIINNLNAESWKHIKESFWTPIVDIKMPRFTTEFETDLTRPLADMGAPSMFDMDKAQLPNICSNYTKGFFVGLMKQKAAIEVNEEGTKTTAVTVAGGVTANVERPMNVDFHADRPFVYVIQELSTGVVFFVGVYYGK